MKKANVSKTAKEKTKRKKAKRVLLELPQGWSPEKKEVELEKIMANFKGFDAELGAIFANLTMLGLIRDTFCPDESGEITKRLIAAAKTIGQIRRELYPDGQTEIDGNG